MRRWLLWFLFGLLLFLAGYWSAVTIKDEPRLVDFAILILFLGWLFVTLVAVPLRAIWWLVFGRRRAGDTS